MKPITDRAALRQFIYQETMRTDVPMATILDGIMLAIPECPEPTVVPEPAFTRRVMAIFDELKELHARKAHDYGTEAEPQANLKMAVAFGIPAWVGVAIRMQDKMIRLQSAATKGTLLTDSLEDAFRDLAVYAVLALVLLEEEQGKLDAP